jgi:hypothetical protein
VGKYLSVVLIAIALSVKLTGQAGGNILFAERTDQPAACVLNGDLVTLQIYPPLVKPEGNWLAKGKAGGIIAKITVTSDTDQPIVHSVLKEVEFKQDDQQNDFVRLPMTMLLTNHLAIVKDGQPTITAISINIKYIGKKSPTAWGAGLQTMANLVTQLPLPPGPYAAGAKQLSTFTTNLVTNSLQVDNPDTKDAKVDMDVSLFGVSSMSRGKTRCVGSLEVGAYALTDAWPTTGEDNFVNVDRPTDYCVKAEPGGGASNVTFWFQKRESTDAEGHCTGTGTLHILANPHVPILVTAVNNADLARKAQKGESDLPIGITRLNGRLVPEPLSVYSNSVKASLALCSKMKIATADCVGFDKPLDPDTKRQLEEFTHRELNR